MTKTIFYSFTALFILFINSDGFSQCETGQTTDFTFNESGVVACETTPETFHLFSATGQDITITHQDGDNDPNDGPDYIINTVSLLNVAGEGLLSLRPGAGEFTEVDGNSLADYAVHWIIKSNTHVILDGDLFLHYGSTITIEEDATLEITGDISLASSLLFCDDCLSLDNPTREAAEEEYANTLISSITINNLGNLSVGGDNDLPVELISFTGEKIEDYVVLNWSTATEINSSHFLIERSSDKTSWEEIGYLETSGNSSVTIEYSFVDEDINEINFYRLVHVDFDQTETVYGPIEISVISKTLNVAMYPNILSNGSSFKVALNNLSIGSSIEMTIYDVNGKFIDNSLLNTINVNSIVISQKLPDNLRKGLYFLITKNGSEISRTKFMID
ncbi:T9SS type A sorting domain-containing protein [Flammeovirga sp. MY04]|uniref:T9SS type A sorting domain-containing protein n=1 Tax=Flammeovirga sp. MY04 TaxID=1191459 RepID=UPI00080608A8|nr:T9SS type A sorting domain-containing protein [Flammeovirga sp. MY04]ANQ50136.1 T9SS type A sorting domain-containing protein [Flammeovirga sp. MY04]